jgi:hypothetical protein
MRSLMSGAARTAAAWTLVALGRRTVLYTERLSSMFPLKRFLSKSMPNAAASFNSHASPLALMRHHLYNNQRTSSRQIAVRTGWPASPNRQTFAFERYG